MHLGNACAVVYVGRSEDICRDSSTTWSPEICERGKTVQRFFQLVFLLKKMQQFQV